MATQAQILQFLQGPMVWVALIVFIAGIIIQSIRLWRFTQKRRPAEVHLAAPPRRTEPDTRQHKWIRWTARIKTTALGASPCLSAFSIIFHICLFVTPLFLMGHNVLIESATGVPIPYFSEHTSDLLTVIVLGCGLFFLLRRLFLKRVRAITSAYDFVLLAVALLPFLTGLLAHHHLLLEYNQMILVHMAAGELMLIMIPFSKFFHMIFFFFGRFFIVNEYSLGAPKRSWQF